MGGKAQGHTARRLSTCSANSISSRKIEFAIFTFALGGVRTLGGGGFDEMALPAASIPSQMSSAGKCQNEVVTPTGSGVVVEPIVTLPDGGTS
jgi:hypothetical protein